MTATKTAKELFDELHTQVASSVEELRAEFSKNFATRDTELCEKIQRQVNDALEKMAALQEKYEKAYSLPGVEVESPIKKGFSISRAALAIQLRDHSYAPYEHEVFKEMRTRAMTAGDDPQGGYLVPTEISGEFIDRLRADAIVMQLGARMFDVVGAGTLVVNKLKTSVAASWIGESTQITETKPTFGQMTFKPRKLAAMTKIPNELITDSAGFADEIVRMDFAQQFALALDLAALNGSGNVQPIGVIQQPGVLTESLASIDYQSLIAVMFEMAKANSWKGKLGWAIHPIVLEKIQTMGNSTAPDIDIARRLLTEAPITQLLGFPFFTTTQLPSTGTGPLIYGNWEELWVPTWKRLELRASDSAGAAFEDDQTWVRGIARMDVGVRHPESFVVATNVA